MITDVTTTTGTAAASDAMKKSLGMNKDDFMKLFIAQLQYQDPLKPQDPTAMLDQLSQLSLVEQSYNANTALNSLITAQNNSAMLSSVSFIGKDVKANGNSISFDGSNAAPILFNLPLQASSAALTISTPSGSVLKNVSLGALSPGDTLLSWDGTDNSGATLPAGAYTFAVTGTAANGSAITARTYTYGKIDGVSISGSTPMLSVGNSSVALTDIISVSGG